MEQEIINTVNNYILSPKYSNQTNFIKVVPRRLVQVEINGKFHFGFCHHLGMLFVSKPVASKREYNRMMKIFTGVANVGESNKILDMHIIKDGEYLLIERVKAELVVRIKKDEQLSDIRESL